MLGLIHRTVLGKGPPHFKKFFMLQSASGQRHRFNLADVRKTKSTKQLLTRSALGLIAVYNMLPEAVFNGSSVKDFQRSLQELVKQRASAECEDWADTFSPRLTLQSHPLRSQ